AHRARAAAATCRSMGAQQTWRAAPYLGSCLAASLPRRAPPWHARCTSRGEAPPMQHVLFQRDSALVRELVDEELAMVASYTEALERSESSYLRLILRDLLRSHARRIEMLREQLQALGGRFRTPDRASSRLAGDAATATGSHEIARDKAVVAGLVALE